MPSQVMVANGSLEGGAMLFEHLLGPGDRVVVEQPTYDRTLLLLQRLGVELVPVPLEADGLDLAAFEAALAEGPIKLAHVIPNAHNPAGCTLSSAKRARLVELAAEHGFWIFEDDPYRELPFEGEPLETMLSLDEAGRVIHASSFSKTVSPGVRVGYLAGPAEEIAKLAKRANETYISPNMLAESIVLELCRSGELDRNIAFVKGELKARCDALVAALGEQIPEAEFVVPEGGYFLWLDLAAGTDTTALLAESKADGRHLRRRPRLHDRGRREQPPPLLRAGAGGPHGRGRLPHRRLSSGSAPAPLPRRGRGDPSLSSSPGAASRLITQQHHAEAMTTRRDLRQNSTAIEGREGQGAEIKIRRRCRHRAVSEARARDRARLRQSPRSLSISEPKSCRGASTPTETPRRRVGRDSALAGSLEAISSISVWKSSAPPCTGRAQTSSTVKSGAISRMRQGRDSCAAFGSLVPDPRSIRCRMDAR